MLESDITGIHRKHQMNEWCCYIGVYVKEYKEATMRSKDIKD